jgi:Glycosyltransferase
MEIGLKILFITHYSGMYGANQSLCSLMVAFKREYNIIPIVLLPREGEICAYLEQEGIRYVVSHFYWWVNNDKGVYQWGLNIRKQIRNRLLIKKLSTLFGNENIDLVYSNSITINIGVYLSRQLNCPHIWHLRETMIAYGFRFSLGNLIAKHILKKGASSYIAISNFVAQSYASLTPTSKTHVIYNGVSMNILPNNRKNDDGNLHICLIGVLSEQKNQMDAVEALNILVNERNCRNIRLHIIGGYKHDYLQQLNGYIETNHLSKYINNHGYVSSVHPLLDQMNLGLVCARDEGFGRVSIEFMLHALPVIASKSGANEEIVRENMCGYLYPIYDVNKLADTIERFLSNPTLLDSIGKSAQEHAINHFSSHTNCELLFHEIENLVPNQINISEILN